MSPAMPITLPTQCNILWFPRHRKGEGGASRKTHDSTGAEGRNTLRIVVEGGLR